MTVYKFELNADPLPGIWQARDSVLLSACGKQRAKPGVENHLIHCIGFTKTNQIANDMGRHHCSPAIHLSTKSTMPTPDFAAGSRPPKTRIVAACLKHTTVHTCVNTLADIFHCLGCKLAVPGRPRGL